MNAARPLFHYLFRFWFLFFNFFYCCYSLEYCCQAESHLSLDILCIRANVLQLGTGTSAVAELSSSFPLMPVLS